jgi:hypothetical protein
MKDMMINIHVEGQEVPFTMAITKVQPLIKELDRAGKKWRLGSTC